MMYGELCIHQMSSGTEHFKYWWINKLASTLTCQPDHAHTASYTQHHALIRISFMLRHTAESMGVSSPPSLGVIITSLLLLCAGLKLNDHGRLRGKVSCYFCSGSSAKILFTTLNGNMDSRTVTQGLCFFPP